MKKLYILFFIFIICIYSSYADTITLSTAYDSDSFPYSDNFENHDWQYTETIAFFPDAPILNPYGSTYALGINENTSIGTSDGSAYIERTFMHNFTTGLAIIEADFNVLRDDVSQSYVGTIGFNVRPASSQGLIVYIAEDGKYIEAKCGSQPGCSDCNMTDFPPLNAPYSGKATVVIDIDSQLYSAYWDGSAYGCKDIPFSDSELYVSESHLGYHTDGSDTSENLTIYIDNYRAGSGEIDEAECPFPQIFCDRFNYISPLQSQAAPYKWYVYEDDYSLSDPVFSPSGNRVIFDEAKILYHDCAPFKMGWEISEGTIVNSGVYASEFTAEFDLNITAGEIRYFSRDYKNALDVYDLNFIVDGANIDIYKNDDPIENPDFQLLCNDCLTVDTVTNIKIRTQWAQRSKMPFNSTFINDTFLIFADDTLLNKTYGFIDPSSENNNKFFMDAAAGTTGSLDDYFIYIGKDKYTDTTGETQLTYEDLKDNESIVIGSGSSDLATIINDFWGEIGIKSLASRVIVGLIFLIIFLLAIVGLMISSGQPVNSGALMILAFFFMIFEVFIKLLPAWILFIGIVLTALIGAFSIGRSASGG